MTPLSVADRPFAYDANGNLTADGQKSLTWSNDNCLSSVVKGGQTTSFAYGPDGAVEENLNPRNHHLFLAPMPRSEGRFAEGEFIVPVTR